MFERLTDEEIKKAVKDAPINERGFLDIDRSIAQAQVKATLKDVIEWLNLRGVGFDKTGRRLYAITESDWQELKDQVERMK